MKNSTSRITKKEKSSGLKKRDKEAFLKNEKENEAKLEEATKGETELEAVTERNTNDSRVKWAATVYSRGPKAIAKEFIKNKKIKPSEYTTKAYDAHDAKNRYNDIICMDATRVVLKDRQSDEDYIHASWIAMPDGQKYICTQGPMRNTHEDFWQMIYTERCQVIIMLCDFIENSNEKCSQYIPKGAAPFCLGQYLLTLRDQKPDPAEGVRHTQYTLENITGGTPFTVNHLWYPSWTDHSAPTSGAPTATMLSLARKLAKDGPITVHCSAGIGRSATFITIDYGAQKIRENGEYSMVDALKDVRGMRYQAIQSGVQYAFLHVCVIELFILEGALNRTNRLTNFMSSYADLLNRFHKKNAGKL